MSYHAVPGRVSRKRLQSYLSARKRSPWYIRAYLNVCDFMRVDPDTLASLPEVKGSVAVEGRVVPRAAALPANPPPVCPSTPLGCFCPGPGGPAACVAIGQWCARLAAEATRNRPVGTFTMDHFAGSPQQHAILNRHLLDYFRDRARSQETTPYQIPASQMHLLPDLGMEPPQPDAPTVPHGLHKSIEEAQLSRMRNYLPADNYNLICVKDAKVARLPTPATRQNPVRDAKDSSRFPGWAIRDADLAVSTTHFMHDVASEVTPHELVEKLARENPEAHLFVTGMNPAEVVDRAQSFEPASHTIWYEGAGFNYVFAGSEAESYFTPIDVTLAWIHTSSVVASTGRTYHVVLLDNKLGHCLYHVFCGDVTEQHTRTYSTGSMVRLPPTLSGTLRPEYIPARLLSSALEFVRRTPDLSTRNLSAKVTQVANTVNPRTTARERWVVWHVMSLLAPYQTWGHLLWKSLWTALYAVTLQWHMLAPVPDVYHYLDERERYRIIHPTRGGGWSRRVNWSLPLDSIPNNPTMLQRLSAFTASAFVFLIPKIALGEVFTWVFFHVDLAHTLARVWGWFDIKPLRALLTLLVVVSAAVVPGHVLQYFTTLSSHFWRQLWWPGYWRYVVQVAIVEITGAPGAHLCGSPGRGWAWQALLWAVAAHTVVPGLVPALVVPWVAFTCGWHWLMAAWLGCAVFENLTACRSRPLFLVSERPQPAPHVHLHRAAWHALRGTGAWAAAPSATVVMPARLHGVPVARRVSRWRRVAYRTIRRQEPWYLRAYLALCDWAAVDPVTLASLPAGPGLRVTEGTVTILDPALTAPPPSLWAAAGADCRWVWSRTVRCLAISVNWVHRTLFRFQRSLGNCGRVPMLQPLPEKTKPTVRRRNVDRVLPTVVVQPVRPAAPVDSQLAIPPDGLNFPDWLAQVEAAYRANPRVHPMLTPGHDCFWQAVSSLGGTPHMWFCWYMEFMRRRVPPNQAIVGHVTIVEMHVFASISNLGLNLTGVTEEVTLSANGRPTLNVRITNVPFSNDLHAELAPTRTYSGEVNTLARILRTLRANYPQWLNGVVADHQGAPPDSVPVPSATLRAIAGNRPVPLTMHEITDALTASFDVLPFTNQDRDGYYLQLVNAPGQGSPLYTYADPIGRLRVARTTPAAKWRSLRTKTVGANPRQERDNATRNNARPEPAMWVTLMNELRDKLKDYSVGHLPAVPLERETVMFTADVDRAARLVSDLKAHPAVLGGKADARWLQSLDSVLDLYRAEGRSVTVPVHAYFGVWGSGKTTATADYLRELDPGQRQLARVVSHTESLRAKAKLALDFPEMRGVNFPTIPGLLSEPSAGPLVFDDAGKFYGGILDLVLLTNPMVSEVVVNGDPAQALTKFPVGGTQSEFDLGPMAVALQTTKYATLSHRSFGLLAQAFGVHTTNPRRGHITHTVGPKAGIPVTTTSPRYVQVLASAGRQAYTHDTIQGEDFDTDVEVDMSALEEAVSDRSAYVALTRSKTGVYLHMNAADPRSVIKAPPTGSDLLNAIIYSMRADNLPTLLNGNDLTRAAFYAHLHTCMPNLRWFAGVGARFEAGKFQQVVAVTEDTLPVDGSVADASVADHVVSSAGPLETFVHETHFGDKEARERSAGGLQTDQFKDAAFVNPHVHKRADHATYKLTVKHRIHKATPAANYTRKKRCPRLDMIEEFDRLCPVLPKWTPEKHSVYVERAVREYVAGRTDAAVDSKLAAHDPDRLGTDVINSLKAQVIKKDEKREKFEAIPGQLIYEYDILQTLEDAAYALFLEEEVIPAFPPQFLFYRRMNPAQFRDEYKRRWRVGNGVYASDATRWDVGCDAGVLNFDEHVFRRCGFPSAYVDAYVHRRLATSTQHGPLQTGQPSGDRFTWTLNTIRRAVVTSIVLDVGQDDTVAVNGDDAAMDRCATAKAFPDSAWEFKDVNGPVGDFSGFELGGPEPVYSARGIHYRTMILVSRDPTAQDKWVNYLELLSYCDMDSWEAIDVARLAHQHMRPELFEKLLPAPLRPLFPHIFPSG